MGELHNTQLRAREREELHSKSVTEKDEQISELQSRMVQENDFDAQLRYLQRKLEVSLLFFPPPFPPFLLFPPFQSLIY